MAEEIVAVAVNEEADFAVRLVETETALATIILSTKEIMHHIREIGECLKLTCWFQLIIILMGSLYFLVGSF